MPTGLIWFQRNFVKHYSNLEEPFNALFIKDTFELSDEANRAFELLKKVMSEATILSLSNIFEKFILKIDVVGLGMGETPIQI